MVSKGLVRKSVDLANKSSILEQLCQELLEEATGCGFDQEDIFSIHLALEEAFLNAVKHGNKMDPQKKVTVEWLVDGEKVDIRLADEGEGFQPEDVPDPRCEENLYRPEGRGLLLINAYMHLVEYNEQGNGLHMVRYKDAPLPGGEKSSPA